MGASVLNIQVVLKIVLVFQALTAARLSYLIPVKHWPDYDPTAEAMSNNSMNPDDNSKTPTPHSK